MGNSNGNSFHISDLNFVTHVKTSVIQKSRTIELLHFFDINKEIIMILMGRK